MTAFCVFASSLVSLCGRCSEFRLLGLSFPVKAFELGGGVLRDVADEVVHLPAAVVRHRLVTLLHPEDCWEPDQEEEKRND